MQILNRLQLPGIYLFQPAEGLLNTELKHIQLVKEIFRVWLVNKLLATYSTHLP